MPLDLAPRVHFDTTENVDKVFEYAEAHDADPRLTRVVFPLLDVVFKPEFICEDNLQGRIASHKNEDGLLAVFMKHRQELDPLYVAGVAAQPDSPIGMLMQDRAFILAKIVLADNPWTGALLSRLGISIVVRKGKNDNPGKGGDYNNPRFGLIPHIPGADNIFREKRMAYISEKNIALGTAKFDAGQHGASFVEGSRQGQGSRVILPENVHLGLVEMARRSKNAQRIAGICIAADSADSIFIPTIAITHFIEDLTTKDDSTLKEEIAAGIQEADDIAALEAELRRGRPGRPSRLLRQLIAA